MSRTCRRLILASASPARLRVLQRAGLDPQVIVSGVAEDTDSDQSDTATVVTMLAARKAAAVASRLFGTRSLVLGCDSLLNVNGVMLGKPATAQAASETWQRLSGTTGALYTGHCLIDTSTKRTLREVGKTIVRFGEPTNAEIAAYVASGEPLGLAGGFSIEGRGAPFIEGIDGDASNVLGLSMPILRQMLSQLGVAIADFWDPPQVF